jgi:hypothetical protein
LVIRISELRRLVHTERRLLRNLDSVHLLAKIQDSVERRLPVVEWIR